MKPTMLDRREGFWKEGRFSVLPLPAVKMKPWIGKGSFLKALAVKERQARCKRYKGYSSCRICKCRNGSGDYHLDGWVWPEGFAHYIRAHNIRPSLAFQEWVIGKEIE